MAQNGKAVSVMNTNSQSMSTSWSKIQTMTQEGRRDTRDQLPMAWLKMMVVYWWLWESHSCSMSMSSITCQLATLMIHRKMVLICHHQSMILRLTSWLIWMISIQWDTQQSNSFAISRMISSILSTSLRKTARRPSSRWRNKCLKTMLRWR